MLSVLQRVQQASVTVEGEVIASIARGVLVLVGVETNDTAADAEATAHKIAGLRIFGGRTPMDLTLAEVAGSCLVVSQFTLAGSVVKGRRPGFSGAAEPMLAQALYERVAGTLVQLGVPTVTGRFRADMEVALVNEGPVTFVLRTREGRLVDP